jgi:hypothetical protein
VTSGGAERGRGTGVGQALAGGGTHPLQEMVAAEAARRVESRGAGALDPALVNARLLRLSNNNCAAAVLAPQRYAAMQGAVRMSIGGLGRLYFEVAVAALDSPAGSTAALGVDVPRLALTGGPVPGLVPGEDLESCAPARMPV